MNQNVQPHSGAWVSFTYPFSAPPFWSAPACLNRAGIPGGSNP